MELRQHALQVLGLTDPEQKTAQTLAMQALSATYSIAQTAPLRAADARAPAHPRARLRRLPGPPRAVDYVRNTPNALAAADILDVILRDEVGHVAIGNHWYRWLCAQSQIDAQEHYPSLVQQYQAPRLRPPLMKLPDAKPDSVKTNCSGCYTTETNRSAQERIFDHYLRSIH